MTAASDRQVAGPRAQRVRGALYLPGRDAVGRYDPCDQLPPPSATVCIMVHTVPGRYDPCDQLWDKSNVWVPDLSR